MEVSLSTVVSGLVSSAVGVESTLFFSAESLSFAGLPESLSVGGLAENASVPGLAESFVPDRNEDVDETELIRMRDKVVSLEEDREQCIGCIAVAVRVT